MVQPLSSEEGVPSLEQRDLFREEWIDSSIIRVKRRWACTSGKGPKVVIYTQPKERKQIQIEIERDIEREVSIILEWGRGRWER